MESATKALEMAFAIFVFIAALGLSIMNFSKVRNVSEIVLKNADSTTYYGYATYDEASGKFKYQNGEAYSYTKNGNRIVGFETIIPTVYKYNRENYTVQFKTGSLNEDGTYNIDGSLAIYTTTTNSNNWSSSYKNDFTGSESTTEKRIYRFDINEETNRNEPWIGSNAEIKKHLDAIFGGTTYHLPQYAASITRNDPNYSTSPLNIKSHSNSRFIEEVGIISKSGDTEENSKVVGNKTTGKTIITYILIN